MDLASLWLTYDKILELPPHNQFTKFLDSNPAVWDLGSRSLRLGVHDESDQGPSFSVPPKNLMLVHSQS